MRGGTRLLLPFREKCEVFLLHGSSQVVTQDRGHYLMFPGGGVDTGEDTIRAAKRETLEETGALVKGPLQHLVTVDFIWHPEWADNAKRQSRYAEFQGERVHIFVGCCKSLGEPTSEEGDGWIGRRTMSIKRAIQLTTRYAAKDHPNTYPYRVAQISALNSLLLLARTSHG